MQVNLDSLDVRVNKDLEDFPDLMVNQVHQVRMVNLATQEHPVVQVAPDNAVRYLQCLFKTVRCSATYKFNL